MEFKVENLPSDACLILRDVGHDDVSEFARDCFAYSRPHDSFGGKRRALAFEILSMAGMVMDLPDIVERARRTDTSSREESSAAIEFLREYSGSR